MRLNLFLFILINLIHSVVFSQDIMFFDTSIEKLRESNISEIMEDGRTKYKVENNSEFTLISIQYKFRKRFYDYVLNDSITNVLSSKSEVVSTYFYKYSFDSENRVDSILNFTFYPQVNVWDTLEITTIKYDSLAGVITT